MATISLGQQGHSQTSGLTKVDKEVIEGILYATKSVGNGKITANFILAALSFGLPIPKEDYQRLKVIAPLYFAYKIRTHLVLIACILLGDIMLYLMGRSTPIVTVSDDARQSLTYAHQQDAQVLLYIGIMCAVVMLVSMGLVLYYRKVRKHFLQALDEYAEARPELK